ncbi:hypothetical protein [Streptomyces sp. NBC_01296]|uniref:hypothetical protein n=1 Tax=Streptomyces sp. NBC_01296 TaxID=2903816 RepID=UPI002E0EA396|nr:hypothetical protein OG299_38550 [Streptomyces sp. NBC_01296]
MRPAPGTLPAYTPVRDTLTVLLLTAAIYEVGLAYKTSRCFAPAPTALFLRLDTSPA